MSNHGKDPGSLGPLLRVVAPGLPPPPDLAMRAATAALTAPRATRGWMHNIVPWGMVTAAVAVAASALLWLGPGRATSNTVTGDTTGGVAAWETWPSQMLASASQQETSRWGLGGVTP